MGGQREYNEHGLNEKQTRFCEEFLIDLNATQSAIRAGYKEKTAYSMGSELLNKPEVQKYISHLKQVRSKRTEITADRVLAEFAKIAFSDVRSLYKEDGSLKRPHEMGDEALFVSSIETDELFGFVPGSDQKEKLGETKKIRMCDKQRALENLGKHLGIYEKDNNQRNNDQASAEELKKIAEKINAAG
jgi:phage terminase small subunit